MSTITISGRVTGVTGLSTNAIGRSATVVVTFTSQPIVVIGSTTSPLVPVVSPASFNIPTNPAVNTLIGHLTVSNIPLSGMNIAGGDPNHYFVVSPATQNLTTSPTVNPVPDSVYNLGVTATNAGGTSPPGSVAVTVGAQVPGFFNDQNGSFTIFWDAVPTTSLTDTFSGLAFGPQSTVTAFACIVRFNPSGTIDARNGGAYQGPTPSIPYSGGTTYHFRMVVRIGTHTYDIFVTPQGQSELTVGTNFAFRAEQGSIANLDWLGTFITSGGLTISNMVGPPQAGLVPVVAGQSFSLDTTTGFSAGEVVGTMTALYEPTSWAITAGNAQGNFAITSVLTGDFTANITVTSAGVTNLANQSGTATLTILATNAFGTSANATATVSYSGSSGNVLHATTANFASQVAAATAGTTILMATGDYGTWSGTNKAITLAPEAGANPILDVTPAAGNGGWTIDGGHTELLTSTNGPSRTTAPASFNSPGITIRSAVWQGASAPPQNITFKRCWFTGTAIMDNDPTDGSFNWTFDRCYWNNIGTFVSPDLSQPTAAIQMWGSNIMVKNCFLFNCLADGIQCDGGTGLTVQDSEIRSVKSGSHPTVHTDALQWFGGAQTTLLRNWFIDFDQGTSAFDSGASGSTITDNVYHGALNGAPTAWWIELADDNPASSVLHNTVVDGTIACGSKSGHSASITIIRNNFCTFVETGGIGSPVGPAGNPTADHNQNLAGVVFVGGSTPTTYQGYKLAVGSAGIGTASDGSNIGARIQ